MVRFWHRGVVLLALVGAGFTTPALGQTVPVPQVPPTIGAAEIEAAKALLAQAKGALQPEQYQRLEKGLVEAEGAFQRFAKLARAGGQTAQVARGAQALTAAQRASKIAEGLGKLSAKIGPLLVAMAMLEPSSTATQEQDYPSWMRARDELEVKLRQVAADSQRVGKEMEAARRPAGQSEGTAEEERSAGRKRESDRCWCVCVKPGEMQGGQNVKNQAECQRYCDTSPWGGKGLCK